MGIFSDISALYQKAQPLVSNAANWVNQRVVQPQVQRFVQPYQNTYNQVRQVAPVINQRIIQPQIQKFVQPYQNAYNNPVSQYVGKYVGNQVSNLGSNLFGTIHGSPGDIPGQNPSTRDISQGNINKSITSRQLLASAQVGILAGAGTTAKTITDGVGGLTQEGLTKAAADSSKPFISKLVSNTAKVAPLTTLFGATSGLSGGLQANQDTKGLVKSTLKGAAYSIPFSILGGLGMTAMAPNVTTDTLAGQKIVVTAEDIKNMRGTGEMSAVQKEIAAKVPTDVQIQAVKNGQVEYQLPGTQKFTVTPSTLGKMFGQTPKTAEFAQGGTTTKIPLQLNATNSTPLEQGGANVSNTSRISNVPQTPGELKVNPPTGLPTQPNRLNQVSTFDQNILPDANLVNSAKGIGTGTVPMQTSKVGGAFNETKNLLGTGNKDVQNALRANRGMYDLNKNILTRQSQPLVEKWAKLTPEDHTAFIQTMQTGGQQKTPELQTLADQYRARFNQDYQLAQSLKPNLPYMDNYFAQSGVWADTNAAKSFYQKFSLGGTPGALQQRTFPTIQDGINAGLKLKETNPEIIALNSRTQLLKAKMAQDFQTQQLAKGVSEDQINAVLDKYLQPGIKGSKLYQTVRQANVSVNSIQLLSGFHVAGTGINAGVSKADMALNNLLSGHPGTALKQALQTPTSSLEYFFKGNKIIKDLKAGNITSDISNIYGGGGKIQTPDIYKGVGFQDALANMQKAGWQNKLKGAMQTIPATINTLAKPVMEGWVPRLKAGAAADLIANDLRKLPKNATEEMINSVRSKAIDSIDNRFGQLNVDNLFWNKTMTDLMSLGMRSPGWNIGTARELGGGVMDWFTKGQWQSLAKGQGISNRSAYAATLPVVVGMLAATYQYIKTGQGPTELKDYFYPKTGQIDPKTGNPERVSFPTYAKDVYAFMTNPIQTVKNKMSPVLSMTSQVMNNQDYYGNSIADPNANKLTQAGQIGKYVGTSILPFSLTGGNKRVNPTTGTYAESIMGITKAPGDITNPGQSDYYNAQAEIQNLNTQMSTAARKTASGELNPNQGQQQMQDIQNRLDNANAVIKKGLPNVAGSVNKPSTNSAIVNGPNGTKTYVDSGGTTHKNLTQEEANQYVTKDQIKQVGEQFVNSGKSYQIVGDQVFRANNTQQGYSVTPKISYDASLMEGKKTSLKNSGDVKGWIDNANSLYQNYQQQIQDPKLDDVEKLSIQNKMDALQKEAGKYQGYGGFKKPKSGGSKAKAGPKMKTTSLSTVSTPKFKSASMRAPSSSKLTTKLKVASIGGISGKRNPTGRSATLRTSRPKSAYTAVSSRRAVSA